MNRRILDAISMTALNNCGDEELVEYIKDRFGEGTLVKDAKTPVVRFEKSDFGLKSTEITKDIKKLMKSFVEESSTGYLVDSEGNTHEVPIKCISALKSIAIYTTVCPEVISECIKSLLNEIDRYFISGFVVESTTVEIEGNKEGSVGYRNVNLLNECRKEIFGILREVGVM